ncbi:MAG: ABC transporter substrate-binding protein [Acidobacteriia bacterium]|nr:ABC transporter substrate-binding protein [Terriglobia bacterium]
MIERRRCRISVVLTLLLCAFFLVSTNCSRRKAGSESVESWGPLTKDPLVVKGDLGKHGGTLITALGLEPRSFNRIVSSDMATVDVSDRILADLIHVNRETQQPEPALARTWEYSADHRTLIMHLREGLRFSDGQPFSADDVLFTFQVLYDPKINSPQTDQLLTAGKPFVVTKIDDTTVQFGFAQPAYDIERVFDSVFMLPRHKLQAIYQAGKFSSAWSISSSATDIVGLGPFRFKRYMPGQFVEMERNPYYWKVDTAGNRLPYLSRLILMIIPDRNAQFLNFQSGALDILNDVRAEDFSTLLNEAGSKKNIVVQDLGPVMGSEQMWFNQDRGINPKTRKPYVNSTKLKWFTNDKFRQAVSYAIDRDSLIKLAYSGRATAAYGPATESNKLWYNPAIQKYPYDIEKAKRLLTETGFKWTRDGSSVVLRDTTNQPVQFTLLTNAGNRSREKMGALIQNDLEKIGIRVNFQPLEFSALIARFSDTKDYEACLLGTAMVDIDPSSQMNIWMSNAPNHQWYPNQSKPATPWEARIDVLMRDQSAAPTLEQRKRDFDEVQSIVSQELPFIYLVARNVLVAAKLRVGNFRPTVLDPHTLWNSEQLYLK